MAEAKAAKAAKDTPMGVDQLQAEIERLELENRLLALQLANASLREKLGNV